MKKGLFRLLLCFCIFAMAGMWRMHTMSCRAETKKDSVLELNIAEEAGNPQAELWVDYEDGSICLRLFYGQEGVLRAGRDFVVTAELTAVGTDFAGELHILMLNEQENHVSYCVSIEAVAGEKNTTELILPMNLLTTALRVSLMDAEDTTLVEHMLYPKVVNYGTYLNVGVLLPEGSTDYMEAFGNEIHYISKSNFGNDYRSLDAYDVLVAEKTELTQLTEGESQLLRQWVERGRMLIVGADTKPEEETVPKAALNLGLQEGMIVQGLIQHISEYEAERSAVVLQNEETKKKYGSNAKTTYIGSSMLGPVLVNTLSDEVVKAEIAAPEWDEANWWNAPGDDLKLIWEERSLPILQQYSCGNGVVQHLSFSLQAEPQEVYPLFYYRLAELLYANLPEYLVAQMQYEQFGMTVSEPVYLLDYFEKKGEKVSVFPYLIILVVYLCVCLPVLFFALRRRGRSKYLWGVFPVTALFFLLVVYGVGYRTRVKEAFCTYLNVIDYTAAGEQGTLYFELSLPTHQRTEVVLETEAVVTFAETMFLSRQAEWNINPVSPESILQEREYRIESKQEEEQTTISVQNVAAFSKTELRAEYAPSDMPRFEVSIGEKTEVLCGSVTNQEETAAELVILYTDGMLVNLGGMEPGEQKRLEEQTQYPLTTTEELYGEELLNDVFGTDLGESYDEISGSLWYLWDELWVRQLQGDFLLVFSKDASYTPLAELASAKHSAGMTVIILPMEAVLQ